MGARAAARRGGSARVARRARRRPARSARRARARCRRAARPRPARLDAPRLARRRLLKPAQQRGPSRHVELRPGEQLQPRERAGVLDRLRRAHRRASRHPALQRSGLLAVEDGDPLAVCDGALHPEGSRGLHRFSFRGCREAVADCGQGSAHPPVKAGGVACGCGGPDGADRRPAAYALSSWCDCSRPPCAAPGALHRMAWTRRAARGRSRAARRAALTRWRAGYVGRAVRRAPARCHQPGASPGRASAVTLLGVINAVLRAAPALALARSVVAGCLDRRRPPEKSASSVRGTARSRRLGAVSASRCRASPATSRSPSSSSCSSTSGCHPVHRFTGSGRHGAGARSPRSLSSSTRRTAPSSASGAIVELLSAAGSRHGREGMCGAHSRAGASRP